MKALRSIIFTALLLSLASGCKNSEQSNTWEDYADWRNVNISWLEEQENATLDGEKIYTKVVPQWNPNAYVLMRWFNDRELTKGNKRPLYTSTIDVKYIGHLYNGTPFDSSYVSISPADSVCRFQLNSLVSGWTIAMEQMNVGDSVEILIPYQQAYGSKKAGDVKPYSALRFNIRLVDVPGEYIRP